MRRVLIANRGEIAMRVLRACRERGLGTVAVYSDADAAASHVQHADAAVRIGPADAGRSYLAADAVLAAARATGCDAVHPGYGFLSENADFARAVAAAGLTFIGPPADAIARMGSKIGARAVAAEAGVPVVPGAVPADQSDAALTAAATAVGYPILLKPSAGGGGIGMKAVHDAAMLPAAVAQARREATAAFGDGTLYVERLVERPRHVEFQVCADGHGHVVHLFERECSIQRRHQKIVEETPSPALSPALRASMGDAAVRLAHAAGYRNAGTVEFLVDGTGDTAAFYFLEMNTRLQVEHPITEQVVGVDLVQAQLTIAAGEPLPWTQAQLTQRGHAIELRLYAEDPVTDLPQAGTLLLYRPPFMPGVRIDSGVAEGDAIPVHYDPLLAKIVVNAETRDAARRRAIAALRSFPVLGVRTNLPLLLALLEHEEFAAGRIDTHFLERESDALRGRCAAPVSDAARAVVDRLRAVQGTAVAAGGTPPHSPPDPWTTLRHVRV